MNSVRRAASSSGASSAMWWPQSTGWPRRRSPAQSLQLAANLAPQRNLIQAAVADLAADDGGQHFQAGDALRADGGGVLGQDHQVGQQAGGNRALDVLL